MSDDHVRVTHRVPEHARDAAQSKTEHGELSDLVRGVYRRIAFGEDVDQHESVKMELERVRDEKDETQAKIRELQADLESLRTKETRLEEKLSEHTSREQKYEGHLDQLEAQLLDGSHIPKSYNGVVQAAKEGEKEPEDVIDELKERNPQVPEYAFEEIQHAQYRWSGVDGKGGGR